MCSRRNSVPRRLRKLISVTLELEKRCRECVCDTRRHEGDEVILSQLRREKISWSTAPESEHTNGKSE